MSYYFISIGGSGARVLEAITHLCAAGLLPNKEKRGYFYAMSIDPDTGNGNLTRTNRLLDCLNELQNVNIGKRTPLLKTPLKLAKPFVWSPTNLGNSLDDVISYETYRNKTIGKLYRALYTKKERQTILNEGFRGRPSIGAAVMAKKAMIDGNTAIVQEAAWQNLINAVRNDVRTNGSAQIFLAGSVFGGTGAAGLPTISRLLRDIFKNNCQNGEVRIGGALLLPYFSFEPTEEQKKESGLFASSENFLTNTKAALRYYSENGGSGYDSMYFIGDNTMTSIPNFSVGATSQCNDAHIVDFFAAMAALHFYNSGDGKHCYYISRNLDNTFQWNDIPDVQMNDNTKVSVRERFVQFTRFIFAYLHIVKPVFSDLEAGRKKESNYPWYVDYLKNVKVSSKEVRYFEEYAERFVRWLNQFEHSSGARSIEIINPESFSINDNHVEINSELFQTLDYGNSKVSINEVITRLNSSKGSWIDIIFGGKKDTNQDFGQDFGLFLRRLYDSCATN